MPFKPRHDAIALSAHPRGLQDHKCCLLKTHTPAPLKRINRSTRFHQISCMGEPFANNAARVRSEFCTICPYSQIFLELTTPLGTTKPQRADFNGPLIEVDEERTFDNVEELVVVIVLVPVVFALNNTETNHGTIHLAERLVVPLVGAGIRQGPFIDQFERLKRDVQPGFVLIGVHDSAFLAGQGRAASHDDRPRHTRRSFGGWPGEV